MEGDLPVCNFQKCRKRLNSFAWITSCSHIFCDEDGSREFKDRLICPACDTSLPGKYDVLRIDINPSDEYKSMVISGQRPDVIMDICSRAISFWNYQCHQELNYQVFCCGKAKQQGKQLEEFYEQMLTKSQVDLSSVRAQIEVLKKELEETQEKYKDSSTKLREKSRQYQKLQTMYDGLRREKISLSFKEKNSSVSGPGPMDPRKCFELPLGSIPDSDKQGIQQCGTSLGPPSMSAIDPSLIALLQHK